MDPRLAPLRPARNRHAALRLAVNAVLAGLSALLFVLGGWWYVPAVVAAAAFVLAFVLSTHSRSRGFADGRGDWELHAVRGSGHVHILLPGFAAGPQIYTGVPAGDRPVADSVAGFLLDRGESVILGFLDRAHRFTDLLEGYRPIYDEAVLFPELHTALQRLAMRTFGETLYVNLHAHSSSAGFAKRFIAWCQSQVRSYDIEGVHYLNPALHLRPLQRILATTLHIYEADGFMQQQWSRWLWRVVCPPNEAVNQRARAEGRGAVVDTMETVMRQVSLSALLGRLGAIARDRSFDVAVPGRPDYYTQDTEIAGDQVVDPVANQRQLVEVYGEQYLQRVLLTNPSLVHGIIAETPDLVLDAFRLYLGRRDAYRAA